MSNSSNFHPAQGKAQKIGEINTIEVFPHIFIRSGSFYEDRDGFRWYYTQAGQFTMGIPLSQIDTQIEKA